MTKRQIIKWLESQSEKALAEVETQSEKALKTGNGISQEPGI